VVNRRSASPTGAPRTANFDSMLSKHGFVPDLPLHLVSDGSDLSELDRALIRILQLDGRRSFAAIGRDLDIPLRTVRRRVNELLDDHVIQITTVSDPVVLGYQVSAMVGVTVDGRRSRRDVLQSFVELPCVDYVVTTTGRYDALVEVLCRDMGELIDLVDERILASPGVRGAETFPYLQLQYQEPAWDAAQSKSPEAGQVDRDALDTTDRDIIAVLSEDGRAAFATVGQRLGISESQVRKRATRLIEDGTMRVTAIANPRSLGFEMIGWIGIRSTPGHSIVELAQALTSIPSITYVAVTAGRFDVLAEVVCRSLSDVLAVLDTQVRSLEGAGATELMLGRDLYYRSVQPPGTSVGR
jgi:DNA-binding Lrp family transcriptional regulator